MPKTCKTPFYKNIRVVLCKNVLEKTPNIREMSQVCKSAILQRLQPMQSRYSLCKMVSLGQKLKMPKTCEKPFYKNIKVVLCKKPLEKTPNIREVRQVLKSAILQRLQPNQRLQTLQNGQFWSKIKNAKNMRKTVLKDY